MAEFHCAGKHDRLKVECESCRKLVVLADAIEDVSLGVWLCGACAKEERELGPVEFQRQNARAYRAKAMGERR